MRGRLATLGFLLLAGSAAGHFHGGLAVEGHTLIFTWESGTVLVQETFVVRSIGSEPYGGRVDAWLPEAATVAIYGPVGAEPVRNGSGLVGYRLSEHGLELPPNATLAFNLTWSAPLAHAEALDRRVVYDTTSLVVEARPPLRVAAEPAGPTAGFADLVRVVLPAPAGFESWHVLVAFAALLLAGAWFWDRRRRKP